MSSTKSSFERVYLSAARKGDIHALEKVLNKATEADDINVKTSKGRTALELAVENGRLDVIQVLLQHGVEIGDALLLAVEAKFFKAVQAILELPQGKALVNAHASENNEDIHPDMTPIILAAHQNDYDIIKLLMEKGAPPIEISEYNTEKHTVQRSVGTLNIYKALASEAYISYIETEKKERSDPFGRAFELAVELRTLSSTEYEFRQEYSDLAEKCEQFAADLLGQTREAEELRTVLNHDSYQGIAADDSRTKDLPAKVIYAVKTDQKKFVAHPYCQQELIERWYSGLADWRDRNAIRNFLLSILIMIFYPILCLVYLIVPVGKFRRFMRTPYIKFLIHTASYFYFLFILIMMTQDFRSYGERSELGKLWMRQMQHQERGPLPSLFEYLLIIWVAGMLWREMKELWSTGFRQYFSDAWNFIDFIQLGLYLSWMGLRTAAFIRVNQERDAFSDFSREGYTTVTTKPLSDTSETNTPLVTDSPLHSVSPTFGSDENSTAAILRHIWASVQYDQQCVANISRLLDSLINQVLSEQAPTEASRLVDRIAVVNLSRFDDISYAVPRAEWLSSDPTLVADCVIALANVISVIRFLRVVVINEYVGPLQISFSKMIKDIVQFIFIFGVIWLAFALGMTEVYWLYAATDRITCLQAGGSNHDCGKQPFGSIGSSLESLFWSLYGLVDLEVLHVEADHTSTETFGRLLFAGYNVAAVIILLNLLIALMGTTYTNISEHADMEWKFSRSEMWMDYFRHGATVPTPFNIIPTPKSLVKVMQYLINHVLCKICSKKVNWVTPRKAKVDDEKYKAVCKQLVMRYVADKASTDRDSGQDGAVKKELRAIKQDLSAVRYEMYGIERRVDKAVEDFNKGSNAISEGMKRVEAEVGGNKLHDNNLLMETKNELMASTARMNNILQVLQHSLSRLEHKQQQRAPKVDTEQTLNDEGSEVIRIMRSELARKDEVMRGMISTLNERLFVMHKKIAKQEQKRHRMADSIHELTSAVEALSSQLEARDDRQASKEFRKSDIAQNLDDDDDDGVDDSAAIYSDIVP